MQDEYDLQKCLHDVGSRRLGGMRQQTATKTGRICTGIVTSGSGIGIANRMCNVHFGRDIWTLGFVLRPDSSLEGNF